ncbi:MAG: (2Fe-2S) ferredoxin domain-containing protein, partial [Chloroflexota bacterium]|nr:(2Fe-2S) ferredoxin domain-containing protein [Chloroflexota bacterium]
MTVAQAKKLNTAADLEALRESILKRRDAQKPCIIVCGGTGCMVSGADEVIAAFREEIERRELQVKADFRQTGCHGLCEQGPLVCI